MKSIQANIDRLREIAEAEGSDDLKEALAYWIEDEIEAGGTAEDAGYTYAEAWERELEYHEEIASDKGQDAEARRAAARFLKHARQILIKAGYYRVMSDREIANTTVSRGTVWDFKIGGVAYTCDSCGVSAWGKKVVS